MTKHHRVQLFSNTIFLHQKHITTGTRHSEITCVSGSREGKCVRVWLSQKRSTWKNIVIDTEVREVTNDTLLSKSCTKIRKQKSLRLGHLSKSGVCKKIVICKIIVVCLRLFSYNWSIYVVNKIKLFERFVQEVNMYPEVT